MNAMDDRECRMERLRLATELTAGSRVTRPRLPALHVTAPSPVAGTTDLGLAEATANWPHRVLIARAP